MALHISDPDPGDDRGPVLAIAPPTPGGGRRARLLALCVAAALGLAIVVVAEGSASASAAQGKYQIELAQLDRDLQQAAGDGYTRQDLAAIYLARTSLAATEPDWVGDRAEFYDRASTDTHALRVRLADLKATLLGGVRKAADDLLADLSKRLAALGVAGADTSELAPMQTELDRLKSASGQAVGITGQRAVVTGGQALSDRVSQVEEAVRAEVAAITAAASDLKVQTQGSVPALAKAGHDAIAAGRNDATSATWLKATGLDRPYRLLERYAQLVDSADVDQAATGAAGARRYADQIRAALVTGMPKQTILISMEGQELWAYQDGKLVLNTLITTGRPPNLATDMGPMKILYKQSPWKMHSPWPPGSPYWYPDAMVQMVLWFTNTGEGLHDASWQSTAYGPGSQYGPSASHGCIHVPYSAERTLFDWAAVGTPVIIIPGDGSSLKDQLAQKTTDDAGNPLTGPKGA